ncbi:Glutamine amidotransferase domain-like protein [Ignavibacterium album JCM 16511]|uniref:Glutamine amidotransferase domain-like protein n=1 Tax=Ignavibacterium album (strain DSM 19864 / JCM 16511 / NBRC 101810 / Mat9-16) TaxID=945713 RepID=I0AJ38_IGNAJ|nr:glutamine amidotransferase [Ignavibacterium album]AFH48995.1 Glutamine amidotransferase domain-like protein [Ignavibacterium album JCM 16511]
MKQKIKIATIDLYNNEPNEGMRCIRDIVNETSVANSHLEIQYDVFETRYKGIAPDLNYDIFISSGGPGSPFEGEGTQWEKVYFNLLEKIWNHNQNFDEKKYIFFICHSFQMMARFFKIGEVNKRFLNSFGVKRFSKTDDGDKDLILSGLTNPLYAADIRQWQVVNPDYKHLNELGAKILSWEVPEEENKNNPALGAVRISNEIVGTQFHPEADPASMLYHFRQKERKDYIINRYGERIYNEMIEWLEDEDKIKLTRKTVLPSFLNNAINELITLKV